MVLKKMNYKADKSPIVGIDLGTTNSAVSVYNAGTIPTLLAIGKDGAFTVPSCVRWDGNDDSNKPVFTVGAEAYEQRYKSNVIYSVKRIMGKDKKISLINQGETLSVSPYVVSGEILKFIKNRVEEVYKSVDECVITVPAYFNQRQIEDTLKAAEYAGLDCKQILKEPTSASYIYSQLGYAKDGNVVIYDLGGGTFDVTHMKFLRRDAIPKKLLTALKNMYGITMDTFSDADINEQYFCKVIGTYGDINLGGDDIDKCFGDMLLKEAGYDVSEETREKLYLQCEKFKKSNIYGMNTAIDGYKFQLTMEKLYEATDIIFSKTLELMREIDMSSVSTIVLVGGSTKSQRIRDNLSKHFPNIEISAVLDPDATVALGAGSVSKAISDNKTLAYADVLPLPISILVNEKELEVCIPKNTSMPYAAKKMFHTLYDNQTKVTLKVYQGLTKDPRECTYLGDLTIKGVPKAPAGTVNILVNFILNGQGQLKIVSRVDGVEKEEQLIINNIMDIEMKSDSVIEEQEIEYGGLKALDQFESCFLPLIWDKDGGRELILERRRRLQEDSSVDLSDLEKQLENLLE